jgi:beta-lactamase regulating signal transducer with metallopeptidase domain
MRNIFEAQVKTKKPHGILLGVTALTGGIFALLVWAFTSIEGLARIFRIMTRLCQGIFSQCLGYAAIVRMTLLWSVGLTLLTGLVYATAKAAITLFRTRRALARLPLKNRGANVVLIDDPAVSTAFTHGIFRPRIYISRGLIQELDGQELRAVFHHELSHKKNRDPLRFFLLSILKDILFFIPLAAYVSRQIRENQERRADDMAVTRMREPFSIAGALLKLAGTFSMRPVEMASILGSHGFVEERIQRLLGEKVSKRRGKGPGRGAILASFLMPAIMLTSLALPLKQGMPSSHTTCTMTHCSSEKPRPEKNCRIHCDKTTRIQKPAPPKPLP